MVVLLVQEEVAQLLFAREFKEVVIPGYSSNRSKLLLKNQYPAPQAPEFVPAQRLLKRSSTSAAVCLQRQLHLRKTSSLEAPPAPGLLQLLLSCSLQNRLLARLGTGSS